MIIKLSIEDDAINGFIVRYVEEGVNFIYELYDSHSPRAALNKYYEIKKRINQQCFKIIESNELNNNIYTKYEAIMYYVDIRGLGVIK